MSQGSEELNPMGGLTAPSSWVRVRVHHGDLPEQVRNECRKSCRELALAASRSGQTVTYSIYGERIEMQVGPPNAHPIVDDFLFSVRHHVDENWKILVTG